MPLNPNGKIDKPALPFPDTAQVAPAEPTRAGEATPTEEAIRTIWARILPNAPSHLPLDESFFDLGGHSILATRLIFEVRKAFLVEAPLGLIFDKPTIAALADAVERMRNADLGLAGRQTPPSLTAAPAEVAKKAEYGQDFEQLVKQLQPEYPGVPADYANRPLTVFLTGATGFLGAFILRDLLQRTERVRKVICRVRAADDAKAVGRLREGAEGRGVWDEAWLASGRLEAVQGDLDKPRFGMDGGAWMRVAGEADAIIHNGALVCQKLLSTFRFTSVCGVCLLFLTFLLTSLPLPLIRSTGCTRTRSCGLRTSWGRLLGSSLRRLVSRSISSSSPQHLLSIQSTTFSCLTASGAFLRATT